MSSDPIIDREELERKLKTSIMEVTFNKINGDKRIMTCTLNKTHLPPAKKDDPITQEKVRKVNEEVMSVWDVNAEGFRSFRMANIIEVKRLGSPCWCKTSKSYPTCDGSHKSL